MPWLSCWPIGATSPVTSASGPHGQGSASRVARRVPWGPMRPCRIERSTRCCGPREPTILTRLLCSRRFRPSPNRTIPGSFRRCCRRCKTQGLTARPSIGRGPSCGLALFDRAVSGQSDMLIHDVTRFAEQDVAPVAGPLLLAFGVHPRVAREALLTRLRASRQHDREALVRTVSEWMVTAWYGNLN